jgi:cholesterol oxidase
MHVLVGCGLGGGSLINAGVALKPDPRVFRDAVWPEEFEKDGLVAEGYARAARWIRPARDPDAARRTKFKALETAGAALGEEPVAAPLTVTFRETVNPAGILQPACVGCGDCCGGCNVGAKNTVALTYLPDAVAHAAQVFTHARVRYLSPGAGGRWCVHFERLDGNEPDTADDGRSSVTADIVVLGGGALGSTEILLRSRERGLALSDRLGHRFSANGDIIAFGYGGRLPVNAIGVGHPSRVEGLDVGPAVSGQIEIVDEDDLSRSLIVQEGVLPSALAPILPAMFLPNGRLLGALQSLISGVYKGPFANLQTFFAVSHDGAGGRLVLEQDGISLHWPAARDEPVYQRMDAVLGALAARAGGRYVNNPLAGTIMGRQPATAHPLGGCGVGRDRSDGVVNHKGQVFDASAGSGLADVHEGLYVVDGAIMPRSLGVNPLLTITALAERALIHLARDYGLSFDDAPRHRERPPADAVPLLT